MFRLWYISNDYNYANTSSASLNTIACIQLKATRIIKSPLNHRPEHVHSCYARSSNQSDVLLPVITNGGHVRSSSRFMNDYSGFTGI